MSATYRSGQTAASNDQGAVLLVEGAAGTYQPLHGGAFDRVNDLVKMAPSPASITQPITATGQGYMGVRQIVAVQIYCTATAVVQLWDNTSAATTKIGPKLAGIANQTVTYEFPGVATAVGCFVEIVSGTGTEVTIITRTVQ